MRDPENRPAGKQQTHEGDATDGSGALAPKVGETTSGRTDEADGEAATENGRPRRRGNGAGVPAANGTGNGSAGSVGGNDDAGSAGSAPAKGGLAGAERSVEPPVTDRRVSAGDANHLSELGEKIFLDRYALKDMEKATLVEGGIVVVCTDSDTGQREIGTVKSVGDREVAIELTDGEVVTRAREHVDVPVEIHPDQLQARVARGIARIEDESKRALWEGRFRWLLEGWKFVPGGRILTAAGTDQDLTYYNCYVVPSPHDSRDGIIRTLSQMTEIMSRGGGVGINLSTLRPRYAYVKGVNGRSSGSVSWGSLYSFVTGLIEQGGSRRGALMLILNVWHPDLAEFITAKREMGRITNANISVGITDDFMDAVREDADWPLLFPDTSHEAYESEWDGDLGAWRDKGYPVVEHKRVPARELWNTIIESAHASAEPGLWFIERANKLSNSYYYAPLVCTNPCGEQPLPGWSVCNLGALNLSRFHKGGEVDWGQLGHAVRYAVRFLDNVIDATPYFFDENEQRQLSERRIGLGTMGLAELMIRCGVRYGSADGNAFLDRLYEFIATTAYLASAENAAEKGSFPRFEVEPYLDGGFMRGMPDEVRKAVRRSGVRNVTLLTQAPTGTTGTMVGTSTGIEPFYSWTYMRQSRLGLHEEKVGVFDEWQSDHPGEELPDHFVTAMDLLPEEHIGVQAAIQRWVDSSISKTCNVPNEYTVDQTRELYEYMYELGCKGGTVYRDGSRDEQVLRAKSEESREKTAEGPEAPAKAAPAPLEAKVKPRPRRMDGSTHMVQTPLGKAYVSVNRTGDGDPFEVFINLGKAGTDLS
ncbi:MAG: adenosylcobalamin-dependent ribonucleoside-diphosphate reductase, partial [Anaerolineae bacterium]